MKIKILNERILKFAVYLIIIFCSLNISYSQIWSPVGTGLNSSGSILKVYNNELIVGGGFTQAGGVTVNRIAKWNGTVWSALGSGMNGQVYALAVYNGELIAGGSFTTAGGITVNHIAKWNGTTWSALGSGMSGNISTPVRGLTVYNGELIACGDFNSAGGVSVSNIAKWNGTSWSSLGSGMNSFVQDVDVYNGELIAGGNFTTAGGVNATRIAKWNGTIWSALGSGVNDWVLELEVYNNELIAGGYFNTAGGITVKAIAKWNGATWSALGDGVEGGIYPYVYGLTVFNGNLIATGGFENAGGTAATAIAQWNGIDWSALSSGLNGLTYNATPFNNELYATGLFNIAGGQTAYSIAKWNPAGAPVIPVGASQTYQTIAAAYASISDTTVPKIIELQTDYSASSEPIPLSFTQITGMNAACYITIRPSSNRTQPIIFSSSTPGQIVDFNGGDWVGIDGRPGGTGTTGIITIENTSTNNDQNTNAVRLINRAVYNSVKFCTIKGSSPNTAGGIIYFSTGAGNDYNTISNCNITNSGGSRPANAIYSSGSNSYNNLRNYITYNNIFNFFTNSSNSHGVFVSTYSAAWKIRNNSFYETGTVTPSGDFEYYVVKIDYTSSNAYDVSNNYIGGSAPQCGGGPMIIDGSSARALLMNLIYINVTAINESKIFNNTLKNIDFKTGFSSGSPVRFYGVNGAGGYLKIQGNNIGSMEGTSSIKLTSYTSSQLTAYMIYAAGSTDVINDNKIGSITTDNQNAVKNAFNIAAIYAASTQNKTVNNNIIGSTITPNSINALSVSGTNAQSIRGIILANSSGNNTLNGNIIANLNNAYTGSAEGGGVYGISHLSSSSSGSNTIQDNIIFNLSSASTTSSSTHSGAVSGISIINNSDATANRYVNIIGNTVYNIVNSSTAEVYVQGIYFGGHSAAGTSSIYNNFVHSLSLFSANSNAALIGIHIDNSTVAGGGTGTIRNVYNNIISLGTGITNNCRIWGIYEDNIQARTNNFYFNTVYIGGSTNGNANTSALNISGSSGTVARNIRNNIFDNSRSRSGGTGQHYAGYFGNTSGLTVDYNDYYAPGTGGILGYYNGDKAALPIVSGQDGNSKNINPLFSLSPLTNPYSYRSVNNFLKNAGIVISGYAIDFGGFTRPNPPSLGAIENDNLNIIVKNDLPVKYSLYQNYPNPFNPVTKIKLDISKYEFVSLKVYDLLGREVADLINGFIKAGTYEIPFNAGNLPSGIYFYKLTAGKFTDSKKMILLK